MELRQANPRRQGDLGEYAAVEWFGRHGYCVFLPFGHSPDVDLIADDGIDFLRVQVKTSTCKQRPGVYAVTLCTRGGNRSWNGIVKRLDPLRIDYLFVLVADGRRWLIPSGAIAGRSGMTLGAMKYAEYEVAPWPAMTSGPTPFPADLAPPGTAETRR